MWLTGTLKQRHVREVGCSRRERRTLRLERGEGLVP